MLGKFSKIFPDAKVSAFKLFNHITHGNSENFDFGNLFVFRHLEYVILHCSEDRRTANVIALPPGVECLTVDRE